MSREFLFASPIVTGISEGVATDVTLTVSEPAVLDFSRLLMHFSYTEDKAIYNGFDLSMASTVTSLLWNGAIQLIRGRNTAEGPGSAFSPYRLGKIVALGEYSAATADTLLMQVQTEADISGSKGQANFAAPGVPRNRREGYVGPIPSAVAYAASPISGDIASGASGTVTLTADSDQILDLSNMVINCTSDASAAGSTDPSNLSALVVDQITLPSGDKLILGQNTPTVAGAIWRAGRQSNWVDFGFELVQGGSTVVVAFTNYSITAVNVSFGCPTYPVNGKGIC
jgi:hypothetical protein